MNKIVAFFSVLGVIGCCSCEYRDVMIDQGVIRGYNTDSDIVFSFYGIPYATAPTGKDMFKGPLPPITWDGVFEATDQYKICPQEYMLSDDYVHLERTLDCLRANIFVPINTNDTALPVFVFIHGGAYQHGYGMQLSPIAFVEKGIIVINFNYRIGVHGFLCLGTELAPGNAALKDQVAALRWIKKNVAHFGGDPDKITISGCSAGASSVELQILSPMSEGTFVQAIAESGSSLGPAAIANDPLTLAEHYANFFGFFADKNVNELERFFSTMSETLLNINTGQSHFLPCIESHNITGVEKFLEDYPTNILTSGQYNKVRLLSGFTPTEGLLYIHQYEFFKRLLKEAFSDFVPSDLVFSSDEHKQQVSEEIKEFYFSSDNITEDGFVQFISDIYFTYPQYVFARIHALNTSPVYLYLFTYNGTLNLPETGYQSSSPGHMAETLYLLEYDIKNISSHMNEDDYHVQAMLRDFYFNFCTLKDLWSPITQEHLTYMEVDKEMTLKEWPLRNRFDFWDRLYGRKYEEQLSSSQETIKPLMFLNSLLVLSLLLGSFNDIGKR